ncbi:hypothetical protein EVA_06139 [gut metagenome]|uniref:Uncharacterized protein n=1 Tax=gut metagenome TaxID=749906 RepID=J9GFN2_9ZZZZ
MANASLRDSNARHRESAKFHRLFQLGFRNVMNSHKLLPVFIHALSRSQFHPSVQNVCQRSISHLLSTLKVNAKQISHLLPEAVQRVLHALNRSHRTRTVKHRNALLTSQPLLFRTQAFSTATTAVVSQYFIRKLVLRLQLGIFRLHLIPYRSSLHQFHHMLPLLRVLLTEHISPKVRQLMHSRLSSSNLRIEVNLTAHRKAVSFTFLGLEETHMVSYLSVLLVEDNKVAGIILTATRTELCRHRYSREAN